MRKTILIIAAISLILSLGCSKRENVVLAKIADRKITVADFERASETMEEKYLPKTNDLAGKKELLDHMINKEAMTLKAIAAGYEKDKDFVDFFENWKRGYLVSSLDNEYIIKKVNVTEQEIKDYYEKMHYEYTISEIEVLSQDEARSLREKCLAGTDFAELAKTYSIAQNAADGGYLGPVPIGKMWYWVEDALFNMKAGDISQPLATTTGWALVKVHSVKKIAPELDTDYARKRMRAIAQKKMIETMKQKIENDMGLTIFPEAVEIVFNVLPPDIPFEQIVHYKVTRQNAPKLEIPEQYQGMILAQWTGGSYTLKDYINIYESLALPERPRHEGGKEAIVNTIDDRIFDSALPLYAEKQLRILEIPEVARGLQVKKEQFLVYRLYQDQVRNAINVTDADIRAYYAAHQKELASKERRDYTIILLSKKEKAAEVADLARKGEDIGSLAVKYSEDASAKENKGHTGLTEKGSFPDYDEVAFSLAEGQVSDPFQVPRGWAIVKISQVEAPKPMTIEQAAESIRQTLTEEQADKILVKKLAEWRKGYPVNIYERNLKKAVLKRTRPPEAQLQQQEQLKSKPPTQ